MGQNIKELSEKIKNGDRLAVARGITIVENNREGKEELLTTLYPEIRKAHRIGIAGPPGVGKSSLTFRIAKFFRQLERAVGVVAVDPTSPFTGGALLGDRIRMNDLYNDPEVFIRSMASRGSMGGLAVTATEAGDILDASGKPIIIFETVGIGQTELDVAEACDTTILVLAPESGDGIQAIKAGFMEIADIFVINKADREGADKTIVEIESALTLRPHGGWDIPVLKASALNNEGTEDICKSIWEHYKYLDENDMLESKRNKQLSNRVKALVKTMISEKFWTEERNKSFENLLHSKDIKNKSPYTISRDLLDNFFNGNK